MKASEFMTTWPTPLVFLQYKGIWDMQELYEVIVDFLRDYKFKVYEKMQRHRVAGPFGVERQYLFEGVANLEHYYQWIVTVDIETFDEHEVEVVTKDGQKRMMTKGRLWMRISGNVEGDFERIFEKSAFAAQLRNFYNKYIIKKKAEGVWWDTLHYNVVLKLHARIKEHLNMLSAQFEHRHFSGVH